MSTLVQSAVRNTFDTRPKLVFYARWNTDEISLWLVQTVFLSLGFNAKTLISQSAVVMAQRHRARTTSIPHRTAMKLVCN